MTDPWRQTFPATLSDTLQAIAHRRGVTRHISPTSPAPWPDRCGAYPSRRITCSRVLTRPWRPLGCCPLLIGPSCT